MKEIQNLLKRVEVYKTANDRLYQVSKDVDARYGKSIDTVQKDLDTALEKLEAEKKEETRRCITKANQATGEYMQLKKDCESKIQGLSQWCSVQERAAYKPNPARIDEAEVSELLRMLNEQGIIAWIKKTFKLNGYSSQREMSFELYTKLQDACMYCAERIAEIDAQMRVDESAIVTAYRRRADAMCESVKSQKEAIGLKYGQEKESASAAIERGKDSSVLRDIHITVEDMNRRVDSLYGSWGEYIAPKKMPEKLLLCDAVVDLPTKEGFYEATKCPVWIDLYKSNIIVITTSKGPTSNTNGAEKVFVRSLLARMLKTIPPECCSYSIFDSLHKGASLGRLIDITEVDSVDALDLSFDVFTDAKSDKDTISCAERRDFLRNRPAEINKHIGGRSDSLFEFNKEQEQFELPFSWYVEYNLPDPLDTKYKNDLKELFVNAARAGYSFVFVTTENGYRQISELANQYTETPVIHIDIDRTTCEKDGVVVSCSKDYKPNITQIDNFMSALKKFYAEAGAIDNRITTVLTAKAPIKLRDSAEGITIPIALDSRGKVIEITIGGNGCVHGFISGNTDSGKTTLLHTIILSACLHYHPKDLELWLVDYKKMEFHLYKKQTPPHVKLIGVSDSKDFTYDLLDKIEAEANCRTVLFNKFGETEYNDYRKHEGEPGYVSIPRLLIVIDEFHKMSQAIAGDDTYMDKLVNVMKEYRAQGINCLLADQTFSKGMAGLKGEAKDQIALRIAMRNQEAPQEIKETLGMNRAMYSETVERSINLMSRGDFLMRRYVRNNKDELTDVRVEKFKALLTKKSEDIVAAGKALRKTYVGQYKDDDLLYINSNMEFCWDESEVMAYDKLLPLHKADIRLILGKAATIQPCFGVDLGRKSEENVSIIGGTAEQRWLVLDAVLQSCQYRSYKAIVFMSQYSDLEKDYGDIIREKCAGNPDVELLETTEEWCDKLSQLEKIIDTNYGSENIVCIFIGLEQQYSDFARLPERGATAKDTGSIAGGLMSFMAQNMKLTDEEKKFLTPNEEEIMSYMPSKKTAFNADPIIDKIFAEGPRNAVRCITEMSVYRYFSNMRNIKGVCRHRIAFNMTADDCLSYLGNSNFCKNIGKYAVYSDGGKEVKKLIPYKPAGTKED